MCFGFLNIIKTFCAIMTIITQNYRDAEQELRIIAEKATTQELMCLYV